MAPLDHVLLLASDAPASDYVYGAVAAPSWVLPVAAVLAVLTAAVPILLRPGEEVRSKEFLNGMSG